MRCDCIHRPLVALQSMMPTAAARRVYHRYMQRASLKVHITWCCVWKAGTGENNGSGGNGAQLAALLSFRRQVLSSRQVHAHVAV